MKSMFKIVFLTACLSLLQTSLFAMPDQEMACKLFVPAATAVSALMYKYLPGQAIKSPYGLPAALITGLTAGSLFVVVKDLIQMKKDSKNISQTSMTLCAFNIMSIPISGYICYKSWQA